MGLIVLIGILEVMCDTRIISMLILLFLALDGVYIVVGHRGVGIVTSYRMMWLMQELLEIVGVGMTQEIRIRNT